MAIREPDPSALPEPPGGLDEVSQRGLEIYENRLKALLEPERNGEKVAIHIESGDHEVAPFTGAAVRALRTTHPTGQVVTLSIGPQPDYGLAARLFGGRTATQRAE